MHRKHKVNRIPAAVETTVKTTSVQRGAEAQNNRAVFEIPEILEKIMESQ